MRRALAVLAVALVALVAHAAEKPIGTIVASTTEQTNASTAYTFKVPFDSKISIQCDTAAVIAVSQSIPVTAFNDGGVAMQAGTKVAADQLFPSATAPMGEGQVTLPDAGISAAVRARCITGTCSCNVFTRSGKE